MNTDNEMKTHPGEPVVVHKTGDEGSIQIDSMTGQVLTEADQRPDWADGLFTAMTAERHGFYNQRLGPLYTDDMKSPETFLFEDLSWIGLDPEGDEVEIEADNEHRMSVLANKLDIDLEAGDTDTKLNETMTEIEVQQAGPTEEEDIQLLDDATKESFGATSSRTEADQRTSTG